MPERFHFFHRKPDLAVSGLVDLVTFMAAGLIENRITVTHGPEIPDDAAVLCFEGTYLDEATTRRIRSRAPLGCFVTEIIGDGKFYDGMGHWDGRIRWQKFLEQAGTFDFIWTPVPQDLEILGRTPRHASSSSDIRLLSRCPMMWSPTSIFPSSGRETPTETRS